MGIIVMRNIQLLPNFVRETMLPDLVQWYLILNKKLEYSNG